MGECHSFDPPSPAAHASTNEDVGRSADFTVVANTLTIHVGLDGDRAHDAVGVAYRLNESNLKERDEFTNGLSLITMRFNVEPVGIDVQ